MSPEEKRATADGLRRAALKLDKLAPRFPRLYHGIIRGAIVEENDRELIEHLLLSISADEAVVASSPLAGLELYFFYGHDSLTENAIPSFRMLAACILKLCCCETASFVHLDPAEAQRKGRALIASGRGEVQLVDPPQPCPGDVLPIPWHYIFQAVELEHSIMDWVRYLGVKARDPELQYETGLLWEHDQTLFLPNGRSIGTRGDDDPILSRLIKAHAEGRVGEITIFDGNVFLAAARAMNLLAGMIENHVGKTQPTPVVGTEHAGTKLNKTDQAAADYIRQNPGCQGHEVAKAIHRSPEHFRSYIVPKLKRIGFTNPENGDGYFPPPEIRQAFG